MGFHKTIGIVMEETPVGGVSALTFSSSRIEMKMKMRDTRPDPDVPHPGDSGPQAIPHKKIQLMLHCLSIYKAHLYS